MSTALNTAVLCVNSSNRPPGQRVASPGITSGEVSATRYFRGTSNAAALATRTAAQLYEVLLNLRQELGGEMLRDEFFPVLLKALIVHGASWGSSNLRFEQVLKTSSNSRKFSEHVARFLGYGKVEPQRVFPCTEQRATLLGCGTLTDGSAEVYSIPLPPSLSAQKLWRRLTLTLAWLTPINPVHRAHRRAALWFEPPKHTLLSSKRQQADWHAVRRGTVQHEILTEEKAVAFLDGDVLKVQVNCHEDAGKLDQEIPYALVATLEVAEKINLPIYEEIRQRIRQAIIISPTVISTP